MTSVCDRAKDTPASSSTTRTRFGRSVGSIMPRGARARPARVRAAARRRASAA
jgi:hypothetical protein